MHVQYADRRKRDFSLGLLIVNRVFIQYIFDWC